MKTEPTKRLVHFFKNKNGDFINYILDCPLRERFFKGGPNAGRSYAAPSMCEKCRYGTQLERQTYMIGDQELERPWLDSVVCTG